MPLSLYGSPGSGSAAIEMALRAADVEYRVVRASAWEPDSAMAELLKVNPLGQIPTLVLPDQPALTESAAILIHLGLEFPGRDLLTEESVARAQALRGLVFIAANCYPAVSVSDYLERWTTGRTVAERERVRKTARTQLHKNWDIIFDAFAAELERTKASPGALAYLTVVVSRWSGTRQHLKSKQAKFSELLAELEAHPRIAGVLAEQGAA